MEEGMKENLYLLVLTDGCLREELRVRGLATVRYDGFCFYTTICYTVQVVFSAECW